LNAGANAAAPAAARAGVRTPCFVPVSGDLLNISSRARSSNRPRGCVPARTPKCSSPDRGRASIAGRLDRCYVAALEPIRYRGVLVFDERVDVGDDTPEIASSRCPTRVTARALATHTFNAAPSLAAFPA
jgi:hypothetical protein